MTTPERDTAVCGVWPKTLPILTPEQERVSHDFMKYWHEFLPRRYGIVDWFNHGYPTWATRKDGRCRTLEIGAGLGEHLKYEDIVNQEYYCLEVRQNMADEIKKKFPSVRTVVCDCQQHMDFPDGHFDRIVAIHVLEHLPNLPAAIDEVYRLLGDDGLFGVVIPCDPGWLYGLARKISAERLFIRRYNQPYDWFISREHINSPQEILGLLRERFSISRRLYFPFIVPSINFNLCLGLVARKRR